jgi:hypothetical protein
LGSAVAVEAEVWRLFWIFSARKIDPPAARVNGAMARMAVAARTAGMGRRAFMMGLILGRDSPRVASGGAVSIVRGEDSHGSW